MVANLPAPRNDADLALMTKEQQDARRERFVALSEAAIKHFDSAARNLTAGTLELLAIREEALWVDGGYATWDAFLDDWKLHTALGSRSWIFEALKTAEVWGYLSEAAEESGSPLPSLPDIEGGVAAVMPIFRTWDKESPIQEIAVSDGEIRVQFKNGWADSLEGGTSQEKLIRLLARVVIPESTGRTVRAAIREHAETHDVSNLGPRIAFARVLEAGVGGTQRWIDICCDIDRRDGKGKIHYNGIRQMPPDALQALWNRIR